MLQTVSFCNNGLKFWTTPIKCPLTGPNSTEIRVCRRDIPQGRASRPACMRPALRMVSLAFGGKLGHIALAVGMGRR
jgi:hypothetical protein